MAKVYSKQRSVKCKFSKNLEKYHKILNHIDMGISYAIIAKKFKTTRAGVSYIGIKNGRRKMFYKPKGYKTIII